MPVAVVEVAARTSMGTLRCTGPGRPLRASSHASATAASMSSTASTEKERFETAAAIESERGTKCEYCRAGRADQKLGTSEEMTSIGTESGSAAAMGVIVLVSPMRWPRGRRQLARLARVAVGRVARAGLVPRRDGRDGRLELLGAR